MRNIELLMLTIFGAIMYVGVSMHNIMQTEIDLLENKIEVLEQENEQLRSERDTAESRLDELHEMSWENIEYWMDTLGIKHKEVAMRQIALETGMLTSTICQSNNNLFGMKQPRIRPTTSLGRKRGHAYYASYIESLKDYKLWQDNMYGGGEGGDYYAFLSRVGYAEATHYIPALKSIQSTAFT